jgi:hypothetical protein
MNTIWERAKARLSFAENRDGLVLGLILLVTCLVYLITINGTFTYDDVEQIANNIDLHHLSNFSGIFLHTLRATRPLLNVFFAVAWSVAPGHTWPFHIGLVIVHLLNTALVYGLMSKILPKTVKGRGTLVWGSTVLFALHPLQVQGVSYIMGGLSAFQCFFYLTCLNLYDAQAKANDWKVRLLLGASMLCKESCLLIPAVLVWWDLTIGNYSIMTLPYKRHVLFVLPCILVIVPLYCIVSNPADVHGNSTGFHLFPYVQYLLIQGSYYLLYLKLLFDSSIQSLIHPYPLYDDHFLPLGILGWFICACVVGSALKFRKTYPLYSFFVGFFFLSLVLTNTFIEMINPFAEYRLYQPNLSLFVGIAYLASRVFLLIQRPTLKVVAVSAPLLWLVWSCVLMQMVWRDEAALYVYSLAVYPESYQLTQMLGAYYEKKMQWDLAEEQYTKAIPLLKNSTGVVLFHPYRLLFRIYVYSKQWDKALKEIDLIESELSGGKLPDDGYDVYLRILRKINDRPRFEMIRKKSQAFYPNHSFPEWKTQAADDADKKKGP